MEPPMEPTDGLFVQLVIILFDTVIGQIRNSKVDK